MSATVTEPVQEIWAPVRGYEGLYEISSLGRIRSLERVVRFGSNLRKAGGRFVSPFMGSRKYLVVNLTANGTRRQHFLHKLVLEAFVGERPEGMQACHNNGNPLDCSLGNLRWDTPSGNHKDKRLHGTWQVGEKANNVKLTDSIVREIRSRKLRPADAARQYGTSETNAARIVKGITWPHIHAE